VGSCSIVHYREYSAVIDIDLEWCVDNLEKKIGSIDRVATREDVQRLVKVSEKPSLELWGKELSLPQVKKRKE
jgi:hypothetical protein